MVDQPGPGDDPGSRADPLRENRIRDLAYVLWESDGCPEGTADAYWYRAEAAFDRQESALEDRWPGNT